MSSPTKLAVAYRAVKDLKLDPKNPRLHNEKQVRQIVRSIETFGFNVPVLIDGTDNVIAGHGRLLACHSLGIDEVPTIALEHLSPAQRRAFLIADNRLTENGVWDEKLLGEHFKILSAAEIDFSLDVTGFEMGEIDLFIEGLVTDGEDDEPDAQAPDAMVRVSVLGDLWLMGKHRVLCADAMNEGSYTVLMQGLKAEAVFTDPPYNVPMDGHAGGNGDQHHENFVMASGEMSKAEFTEFLIRALSAAATHSSDGSIHFVCMDWRHMGELLAAGEAVYIELKNLCVWAKDNAGMGSFYRSQHELVFVFKSGTAGHQNNIQLGKFGRSRSNVWEYAGVNSFARATDEGNLLALHPTVKPVALVADAIMDCSSRGGLVLDPFLGSGTTVIAAEKTGRICYGLELDPKYVDTIVRRWQKFTGHRAIHAVTGKTFEDAEKEVGDVG
jgi:DNA modification methylase